jgi:steroid delta-isomerase-like uncharacterized protein
MAEQTTTGHEQVMSDYTELWNGDFSKRDVVAESVSFYHPSVPDGGMHGRDAVLGRIREYHAAFPDFEVTVHDWVSRDEVVMKEYTMAGTHEGEFDGVPPTGRTVESRGMAKIRVVDGAVTEDRLYFDRSAVLAQLGLADG